MARSRMIPSNGIDSTYETETYQIRVNHQIRMFWISQPSSLGVQDFLRSLEDYRDSCNWGYLRHERPCEHNFTLLNPQPLNEFRRELLGRYAD